jgi:hypothetical protein
MIKQIKFYSFPCTALLIVLVFLSCDLKIPVEDMSIMKMKLARAAEVGAIKYAPEELRLANEFSLKCHDEIKKKNIDRASENAEKSIKYAAKSIEISLPPLSADMLEEAKKCIADAESADAETYAFEEFGKSRYLVSKAETLIKEQEYWESYITSLDAIKKGKNAQKKSFEYIPEIIDEIGRIRSDVTELKLNRGSEFAQIEIESIGKILEKANRDIEQNKIKDCNGRIKEARTVLAMGWNKTMKGLASEKIANADKALAHISKNFDTGTFEEELKGATALLEEGKDLYNAESYKDSIKKIDSAAEIILDMITLLSAKSGKKDQPKSDELRELAFRKIKTAENILSQTRGKATQEYEKTLLSNIDEQMTDGKNLYESGFYRESITAISKALLLLSYLNEPESIKKQKKKPLQAVRYYRVKYNPKHAETLQRISIKFYGIKEVWQLIYRANRDTIKDPDFIYPGQLLVIPPFSGALKK